MSEANKRIARQWFEQVWNQKSEEAIDRMFHPDGVGHGFTGSDSGPIGREAFKELHRNFCAAFPDLHIDIAEMVAEGDVVAIRWKATMTHLGDQLGFPASGKKAVLLGSTFMVIEGQQIKDGWNQMDLESVLLKLRTA